MWNAFRQWDPRFPHHSHVYWFISSSPVSTCSMQPLSLCEKAKQTTWNSRQCVNRSQWSCLCLASGLFRSQLWSPHLQTFYPDRTLIRSQTCTSPDGVSIQLWLSSRSSKDEESSSSETCKWPESGCVERRVMIIEHNPEEPKSGL